MKRILAGLLVFAMLFSLCGCGKTDDNTDEQEDSQSGKEFTAAHASEYPYLEVIERSYQYAELRYVTSIGSAYYVNEHSAPLLGHNIVGVTEDYTLFADGTVKYNPGNLSNPSDCGLTNIVEIEQGNINNHADLIALRRDGTIYFTVDDDRYTNKFYHAESWTDIIAMSVEDHFMVGLKSNGTVVATGSNGDGQCDVEEWTDIIAIDAVYDSLSSATYGLKKNGTVISTKGGRDVSAWTDIVAIAGDSNFIIGLKADGTVVVSGEDRNGETKISGWTDIVAIQAYRGLSIGIKSDGTIVSAGDDYVISKYLKGVKLKTK